MSLYLVVGLAGGGGQADGVAVERLGLVVVGPIPGQCLVQREAAGAGNV